MASLPEIVKALWGARKAAEVAAQYADATRRHDLLVRDLAMFCNAAAPIAGATEFERGVEEGKRRVWLHISRMSGLKPSDFVTIADGRNGTE